MTIDTIVLIGLSFAAYRRARRSGRSSLIWIPIVWILGHTIGTVFSIMIVEFIMLAVRLVDFDFELGKVLAYAFTRCGVVIGGLFAVGGAGRPLRQSKNKTDSVHGAEARLHCNK